MKPTCETLKEGDTYFNMWTNYIILYEGGYFSKLCLTNHAILRGEWVYEFSFFTMYSEDIIDNKDFEYIGNIGV